MASDSKKKMLFGGVGVVVLVAVVVFLTRSGTSDVAPQTRPSTQPVARDTDSEFDDEPVASTTRSAPTVDRTPDGRLAGASDGESAVDEEDDEGTVSKKSSKRKKRRSRKKQTGDESDDEEVSQKAGTRKVIPRPF